MFSDRRAATGWRSCVACGGAIALMLIQGCATHSAGFAKIEQEASAGNLSGAIKLLDLAAKRDLTGSDRALDALNRAMLFRLKGDFAASNAEFDLAKRLSEELTATSVSEQAASVVVNEGQKSYEVSPEEQLLVYAFKALNYLQDGDADAAAVEARQFDIHHRLIRESYPDANYLGGAFVRYLNGLIYEAVGETDAARIEFEKAVEAYRQQESLTRQPPPDGLLRDLARRAPAAPDRPATSSDTGGAQPAAKAAAKAAQKTARPRQKPGARGSDDKETPPPPPAPPPALLPPAAPGDGEVVFLLHNGLGPQLAERAIELPNPVPEKSAIVLRVALPRLLPRPVPVARVELSAGDRTTTSEIVEDPIALARAGLEDRLPAIQARALARLVAKNAAVREAKKKAEKKGDTSSLLLGLGAELAAIASERADTRAWSLLPGNIHLARLELPPGRHDLTLTLRDAAGRVLRTRTLTGVEVKAGRRTFLADYYLQVALPPK